jgi:hypothetical protein
MPWYHGSQQQLSVLRPGSSITQNRTIARAFSHRPSAVSQEIVDGRLVVKHNGTTPGYLYEVIDEIGPDDIYPHPHPINETEWEWLTRRELRVRLVERTVPRPEEMLTAEEVAERRRRLAEYGQSGSGILED